MKKKVLICEFSQESNSFSPIVWDIDRFKSMVMCSGLAMRTMFAFIKSPVKGMADAVQKNDGKPVYGFAMRAMSGGPVSNDSVEMFMDRTMGLIEKKGSFDGILLSLHGATISESEEDACGFIVEKIREKVGNDAVIGLSCDMHANITHRIEENADHICGFQTYPHVDFYETGYRSATLVMEKLKGRPIKQVCCRMPMMVPASGYTSGTGRFKEIMQMGHDYVSSGKANDFSLFMMQPWLDVKETASCVMITSENSNEAAKKAEEIGRTLFECREMFWPKLSKVEDAIQAAINNNSGKPVVLAEPADSPNAGAVGDSVYVLEKLREMEADIKAASFVMDPASVELAYETGIGNKALFKLGARYTPKMGQPLAVECTVKSLHNGKFKLAGPAGKGLTVNIGKTAVLIWGKIDIMVCKKPGATGDLNFYKSFGIEPEDQQLIVVKANTSFREAYEPIAAEIFIVDTYGAASADFPALPFKNIDKGNFYPFSKNPALISYEVSYQDQR